LQLNNPTVKIYGNETIDQFEKWIAEGGVGITTYEITVKSTFIC
jgi:hypothetical protein